MAGALWSMSAREIARQIAFGEVSAVEVLDAHLKRIDEVNPALNAVVRILDDEAHVQAAAADEAVRRGDHLGPLHGVPISVKDNIDVVGDVTTFGIPLLAGMVATQDAPAVERMRFAGAIPFARTNLPDLGLRVHTNSALHGLTKNPWDSSRTAGGSSGGEASALASGMSPLGLGNDIGGSLRNPAYACGVTSIKPSTQRVPYATTTMPGGTMLATQLMLVQGVLGRHVADVRLGLSIIAGAHPRDPYAISAPLAGPPETGRVKVALVPEPPGGSTDPVIASAVRHAGAVLAAAGYEVEEATPPRLEDAYLAWATTLLSELLTIRPVLELALSEDAMRFLDYAQEAFGEPTLVSTMQVHADRFAVAEAWSGFQDEYHLIVGPTWTQKPFAHEFDVATYDNALSVLEMMRFVLPQNLLGLPAACVPTGVDGGLPTGVQVTGRRFREDQCLDAAEAIEAAVGVLTPIDPR